jgi:hypothetical protein
MNSGNLLACAKAVEADVKATISRKNLQIKSLMIKLSTASVV